MAVEIDQNYINIFFQKICLGKWTIFGLKMRYQKINENYIYGFSKRKQF